jgi:hypothetical protein
MKTKETIAADPVETAHKAREETEHFSIPFAIRVYPFLIGPRL